MKMGDHSGCSINYFCLGAMFIFVGSVLLCALGFTVVLPHQATRSWPHVICTVTNATYHPTMCSCNHQSLGERICLRRYPCLLISVVYPVQSEELALAHIDSPGGAIRVTSHSTERHVTRRNDVRTLPTVSTNQSLTDDSVTGGDITVDNDVTPSTLTGNDVIRVSSTFREDVLFHVPEVTSEIDGQLFTSASLYNTWSDAFYQKCALNECGAEEWNIKETKRFLTDKGQVGQSGDCYVSPDDHSVVILSRTPYTNMVHAIVWPVVSLAVGITLWLGLCLGCWRMDTEFEPVPTKPRQYGLL